MPIRRDRTWRRLDNAAKIFPSTSERSDTRVFRFSVEFAEQINPEILQKALDTSLDFFPFFLCVMRRGAFWYYLEQCDLKPFVEMESKHPCAVIYDQNRKSLLFNVSYYKNKMNLEIYHVLTDGTGAIAFLKTLIYYYIKIAHKKDFGDSFPPPIDTSSINEKTGDSFKKYYRKKSGKRIKGERAHPLKSAKIPENAIRIIEVKLPTDHVKQVAKNYHATVTVFLTALLIMAIGETMSVEERKLPVTINVPVNLRKYFPSETATNFFGMIGVQYKFSQETDTFDDVLKVVAEGFEKELTTERLALRMNALSALERHPVARISPLPIKNFVLRRARHINDKACTAVVSNVGKISVPKEFIPYIQSVGVFTSTLKLQLCFCSFENVLSLGFTSAFESTAIEHNFVKLLTGFGLEPIISSNEFCR